MDERISNWITEFLIREAPNSSLVTQALTNLPIQNPTTRLKKSLLLRSIQSEIDEASLSEKTLESLELLEELTLQDGSHPTTTPLLDCMKEAYLAVAVECTLKYLIVSEKKYSDAVDRIWRRRILPRCSSSSGSVLMTDELVRWGQRIEEVVSDQEKRRSLIMENSRARAFNSVMVFLKEAWDDMGPSFLQAAAETLTLEEEDKDKRKEKEVLEKNVEFETSNPNPNPNPDEVVERGGQVRPTTPFVSETRKSLKASCMELQALVKDPLPDALRLAHSLTSRPSSSVGAGAGANANANANANAGANANANAGADANAGAGADADAHAHAGARFLPFTGNNRPSLMERKPSARTYEWDDSPEAERNGGPHLPSPERIAVSPLKKYGNLKFAKRRKKRKWSLEEEDTLRKGVERFGKGNWKLILNCYREIFEERTEVDLKDKWRNMTR